MPCVYSSETVQHCMVPVKRNEPRDAIKHTHKIDERQQIFASFPLSSLCCKLKRGEEEEKEKKDFSKKKKEPVLDSVVTSAPTQLGYITRDWQKGLALTTSRELLATTGVSVFLSPKKCIFNVIVLPILYHPVR